jgi:hypothetical protein
MLNVIDKMANAREEGRIQVELLDYLQSIPFKYNIEESHFFTEKNSIQGCHYFRHSRIYNDLLISTFRPQNSSFKEEFLNEVNKCTLVKIIKVDFLAKL